MNFRKHNNEILSNIHPTKGCYASCVSDAGTKFTDEELEFLKAMDRYKREYNRPYPTYREVLYVAKSLGYTKFPPIPPKRNDDVEQGTEL